MEKKLQKATEKLEEGEVEESEQTLGS